MRKIIMILALGISLVGNGLAQDSGGTDTTSTFTRTSSNGDTSNWKSSTGGTATITNNDSGKEINFNKAGATTSGTINVTSTSNRDVATTTATNQDTGNTYTLKTYGASNIRQTTFTNSNNDSLQVTFTPESTSSEPGSTSDAQSGNVSVDAEISGVSYNKTMTVTPGTGSNYTSTATFTNQDGTSNTIAGTSNSMGRAFSSSETGNSIATTGNTITATTTGYRKNKRAD